MQEEAEDKAFPVRFRQRLFLTCSLLTCLLFLLHKQIHLAHRYCFVFLLCWFENLVHVTFYHFDFIFVNIWQIFRQRKTHLCKHSIIFLTRIQFHMKRIKLFQLLEYRVVKPCTAVLILYCYCYTIIIELNELNTEKNFKFNITFHRLVSSVFKVIVLFQVKLGYC